MADPQSPGALSVAPRRFLKTHARKDAETQEKCLQPTDQPFRHQIDLDPEGTVPGGYEAFGLKDASQISRDDGQRRCVELLRYDHRLVTKQQVPLLDVVRQLRTVEADPAPVIAVIMGSHRALVPIAVWE